MAYKPTMPPTNPADLAQYLQREHQEIALQATEPCEASYYKELHAAPEKVRAGMTVLADGTDWDPGSGAGLYCYYGGAWHRLG